jgi:hypothetical protein
MAGILNMPQHTLPRPVRVCASMDGQVFGMAKLQWKVPRPLAVLRESFLIFAFWDMSLQTALICFVAFPVGAVLLWRLTMFSVKRLIGLS